jgi:ABC-type dipeptide/oligopeptide/nickel transport system ATPase component
MMETSSYPERFRSDAPGMQLMGRKWRRLNTDNEHWMCVIVGEEGMGKSYSAIKIGETIDPNFSDENIFFHPADLLEKLQDGDYQAGDVWVLDEAGAGVGNRTWQDSGQKKLNQALQLVRSHNVGFIFTLPRLTELDKQARGRLQTAIEIKQKNDGEFVRGKWWRSEVDRMGFSRGNDTWWSEPTINGKKIRSVKITPPSDEVIEPYEEVKQEFQEEFYEETISELRGVDADEDDDEEMGAVEIANEILSDDPQEYVHDINGGTQQVLDADLIANDYGLGRNVAGRVKKEIKRQSDMEGVL